MVLYQIIVIFMACPYSLYFPAPHTRGIGGKNPYHSRIAEPSKPEVDVVLKFELQIVRACSTQDPHRILHKRQEDVVGGVQISKDPHTIE